MTLELENVEITATIATMIAEKLERNFKVVPTLTLAQAAEELGISDEKMRQLCNSGQIPYVKMDRLYRIKIKDINLYLEKNTKSVERAE